MVNHFQVLVVFRQFELSIIAADEKDIIYTRSNIRHESVYLDSLTYDWQKMKALFLTCLKKVMNLIKSLIGIIRSQLTVRQRSISC